MAKEIERKFLVEGDFRSHAIASHHVEQGYVASSEELVLRVRTLNERGFLTIKSRNNAAGTTRDEWEYAIPYAEACELLRYSRGTIAKRRYIVPVGAHTFEVDCFEGANRGLVVAEVELGSENEPFERPQWLGREVTGDSRYYNSQLLKHPYLLWDEE